VQPTIAAYLGGGQPPRPRPGAIEWPGWCRRGRDEDEALRALIAHGPRYAAALAGAAPFAAPTDPSALEVVERLEGNTTTDFRAPAIPPAADERPLDEAELVAQVRGALGRTGRCPAQPAGGGGRRRGPARRRHRGVLSRGRHL
jgi:hypothetical protein